MIAELIATGDEIRTGALVDSNSAFIADWLEQAGVFVSRHHSLGDDLEMLAAVFKEVGQRADFAIVTGGLGPTLDDLTSEAMAVAAGVSLAEDSAALEEIRAFFRKRGWPMTSSNRKQALFPDGSRWLANPIGTAPGFAMTIGKCRFYCMPGVPAEMRKMMKEQVLPAIEKRLGTGRIHRMIRTLSTFGMGESSVGERIESFNDAFPNIRLGLRAGFPEIQIKLYADGESRDNVERALDSAAEWVVSKMGIHMVSPTGRSLTEAVAELLIKRGCTLAVAESCTGGLIASRLTDVAGSSAFFLFSGVTYSNEAKVRVLGVSPKTLEAHGAVSEETVGEMAEGARQLAEADFGLATSGIAGPDGGTPEKPVGTVCIGLATSLGVKTYRYTFPYGRRLMNKSMFAATALDLLRSKLLAENEKENFE